MDVSRRSTLEVKTLWRPYWRGNMYRMMCTVCCWSSRWGNRFSTSGSSQPYSLPLPLLRSRIWRIPKRTPPFALKAARAYRMRLRTKLIALGLRISLSLLFGAFWGACWGAIAMAAAGSGFSSERGSPLNWKKFPQPPCTGEKRPQWVSISIMMASPPFPSRACRRHHTGVLSVSTHEFL
ncbi:hypothetical protein P280DRAFT_229052 [Massarina eburnea CBS 473.64]|uniref:Uncharacterized protein n=1 Tax=Massarina eburnea CBS 473.64 TaxID=1395130 RepID=A0A6A6S962_9PLEO|nr:hypothetical protein P280DRAFT_229052 [Massarina eburnea CBS 473.64]